MDVGSYIKTINNESVDEKAREKLELEYNTLAMKTRISRLEELTYRVNKNLDTLFLVTHRAVKELLEKSVTKSYNSAHTLKRDPSLRDKKLYKILEQPWSGANYSANIWNNRDKLAGIAQNEITKGIYQGKSAKKISKKISERLDASMKDIERVVRTESKHARNEASAQAYIDMGYEWYMFSSHTEGKSSERTCERCRKINEEKYRFDKRVVGENFPPLHPNCRCTIIPIVKDEMIENSRKEEYTEIVNDFENEKAFREVVIEKDSLKVFSKTPSRILKAEKIQTDSINFYKSTSIKGNIKRKTLQYFDVAIKEAVEKLHLEVDKIPPIIICSENDFYNNNGYTLASYRPIENILKINYNMENKMKTKEIQMSKNNELVYPEKYLSTFIHEFYHFLDCEEYRRKKGIVGDFTEEQYNDYKEWLKTKSIDFLKKKGINYKNVSEISAYAEDNFLDENFDEVCAEYNTKKTLGRKR